MDDEYGERNFNNTDFANQFRDMVQSQSPVNQDIATQNTHPVDKNKLFFIIMLVILALGMVVIVILSISYFSGEPEEEELEGVNGPQDDAESYQDLAFNSEKDSEAPLLVYTAVKNGEVVDTAWLEEFREFSSRYSKEYNKTAISDNATFNSVTIQDAEGLLFPNIALKRILLSTSEGCARFDFYEDLLVVYDYELVSGECSSAEFNYLGNEEN